MRNMIQKTITFILTIGSMALAQGITLPSEPSQAPIGGLGWLAALGGALAYNKLRKNKLYQGNEPPSRIELLTSKLRISHSTN